MTPDEPAAIIAARLADVGVNEKLVQTAYAAIGALEQAGWVIVRKRHQRTPKVRTNQLPQAIS
jgi:hypothetical protein